MLHPVRFFILGLVICSIGFYSNAAAQLAPVEKNPTGTISGKVTIHGKVRPVVEVAGTADALWFIRGFQVVPAERGRVTRRAIIASAALLPVDGWLFRLRRHLWSLIVLLILLGRKAK